MGIFTFNNLLSAVKMNGLSESFLPPMILNMSITASVIILFVLLARLALKKAPKIFSYALWAVVLFRLLCPVSVTTDFSLLGLFDMPAVENTQHTTAMEYIPYDVVHTPDLEVQLPVPPAIYDAVNDTLPQEHAALGADPLEGEFAIGSFIWLLGIGAMAVYSMVSYILLRRKLVGAVLLRDNIYLADGIGSPFVMGFFRPKIYLPSALSEQEQSYIILHEQHHIRRGDHIIKALAFIALCIHWFNPLVWVAFVLSSKDMEMSCDEAVVKKLGEGIRADYSASLLSLATGRRIIAGTPLAFGEGDTKSRIKNMLNWKKPKTWIMLVALVACVVAIVFCATNPRNDIEEDDGMITWELDQEYPDDVVDIVNDYVMQQVEYYNSLGSGENAIGGEYSILEAKVVGLERRCRLMETETHLIELYRLEYRLLPSEPDHVVLAGGMQMEDGWITEYGSTGQPYFAILCDSTNGEETWTLMGMTNSDTINFEYNTDEMRAKHGDRYIAAALELYKAYLRAEAQVSHDMAEDISYYLELAAGETFQDMSLERQTSLLVEYEDLLDDYSLIARETEDGKTAYIVGQYNGDPTESPLYGMYGMEVSTGENEVFQLLYREENPDAVNEILAENKKDFPSSVGYRIEDSQIYWSSNSGLILIQPKDNSFFLNDPWNRYLHTPNGREYIEDAVSRGIDMCGRTDTFLYVYLISEQFGEIAERIALTEAEAQAILAEERVSITEGFGFSASLHIDGQTTYYNEREGIPQTVLDLAVEKCDYRFGDPSYITDTIREARLDCDWLDAPLYADEEDLPRLREILKNAKHDIVGACGYGAKLTLTFTGGEKLTVFKGCDSCDTIVFGSYGGYALGDKENTAFWEMFGLDPDTKERIETAEPSEEELFFLRTGIQEAEAQEFYAEFITLIESDNREAVLDKIFYPVSVTVDGGMSIVNNATELLPYYDDIFTDGLWDRIQEGQLSNGQADLLTNDGLIGAANGAIWFAGTQGVMTVQNPEGWSVRPAVSGITTEEGPYTPPTEEEIHAAIMANFNTVITTYGNGSAAAADFLTEAHAHLATEQLNAETYTFYSDVLYAAYVYHEGKYAATDSVHVPTVLTYIWKDGEWKLDEFWTPGSTTSVATVFPTEAVEILNRTGQPGYYSELPALCDEKAIRNYVALYGTVPTKTFGPEDVNVLGQALTVGEDTMAYEERLAWVQAGPDMNSGSNFVTLEQYREGEGCLAFLGQWVGTPHGGAYVLNLRFADGGLAYLPLPDEGGYASALPDTMEFQDGKFIYEITFPTEELTNEGQTLIHLKGTYHYEVNLADRTLSLTVLQ